jgi:hypothetical protein
MVTDIRNAETIERDRLEAERRANLPVVHHVPSPWLIMILPVCTLILALVSGAVELLYGAVGLYVFLHFDVRLRQIRDRSRKP